MNDNLRSHPFDALAADCGFFCEMQQGKTPVQDSNVGIWLVHSDQLHPRLKEDFVPHDVTNDFSSFSNFTIRFIGHINGETMFWHHFSSLICLHHKNVAF